MSVMLHFLSLTMVELEGGHKSIDIFAARLKIQPNEAGVDENWRSTNKSGKKVLTG